MSSEICLNFFKAMKSPLPVVCKNKNGKTKKCETHNAVKDFFGRHGKRPVIVASTLDEREFAAGLNAARKRLASAKDVKFRGHQNDAWEQGVLHGRDV